MGQYLDFLFGIVLLGISTELIYQSYLEIKKKRKRNKSKQEDSTITEVLFFPDNMVACKNHFLNNRGCFNDNCRFSHSKTSLSELYRHLGNAKKSIDASIFCFTCSDLADILINKHKTGVEVRVITDNEQIDSPGAQLWRLRKAAIPVRTDRSSYFMHHKFVIIDSHVLINGSFNWTRQAITGNQENLLITNDNYVVEKFIMEFSKLWTEFDPDMYENTLTQKAKNNSDQLVVN